MPCAAVRPEVLCVSGGFDKIGRCGMVKINGMDADAAGKTVSQYLEEAGYPSGRIAVERNGGIVPKADYGKTVLQDGDSVEIVCFVGGG